MIQREDEYEFVRENLRNINPVVVLIFVKSKKLPTRRIQSVRVQESKDSNLYLSRLLCMYLDVIYSDENNICGVTLSV